MATAKTAVSIDEDIRLLAHRFWEEEGRPDGRADIHWLRAVSEYSAAANSPKKKAPAKKKAA